MAPRRASSGSPTWGAGWRSAGRRSRPRRRSRFSRRPRSCSHRKASRSATSLAPGSTCARSSTGTATSTALATPSSARSASRARTARSPIPASTGIGGRNARGGCCALDLVAIQAAGRGPLAKRRLHNPRQSEATRVRLGVRAGAPGVDRRRGVRLRVRHGRDRRARGDRSRGGFRGAGPLHARRGRGAARGGGGAARGHRPGHGVPEARERRARLRAARRPLRDRRLSRS